MLNDTGTHGLDAPVLAFAGHTALSSGHGSSNRTA